MRGRPLHARYGGPTDGLPIILLHGVVASGLYLLPSARLLARHRPVLIPDLPGFGLSGGAGIPPTPPLLADLTIVWMKALGIDRAALLGNSFGCQVAVEMAVREPSRIAGLVLLGPTVDADARSLARQALRLLRDIPRERPSLPLLQANALLDMGLPGAMRAVKAMLDHHTEDLLPRVSAPTLVLRGEHDPIAPQRWVEQVVRALPRGQLIVIPDAAHAVNYTQPAALVRVVEPFLEHLD